MKMFLLKLIISLVVIYGCLGVVLVSENLSDNIMGVLWFCGLIFYLQFINVLEHSLRHNERVLNGQSIQTK
jgi:hypothetical protein